MSCFDKYNLIFELFAGWFYSKLLKNAMCNDVKGNDVIALDITFKYIKCAIFIMSSHLLSCVYLEKRQRKIITFLKICQTSWRYVQFNTLKILVMSC